MVPGRPIGLHPEDVAALAANGIHLHFHGRFTHGQWREWIDRTRPMAKGHLHLHPTVGQERWTEVFSRYDAGWLHVFRSGNGGDLTRAIWDDLNLPARMATLAAAGLPMIQRDNTGAAVAIQSVGRELGVGLFFEDYEGLAAQLRDSAAMASLRSNVAAHAPSFTFDAHVDRLLTCSAVPSRTPAADGLADRGPHRAQPSVERQVPAGLSAASSGSALITPSSCRTWIDHLRSGRSSHSGLDRTATPEDRVRLHRTVAAKVDRAAGLRDRTASRPVAMLRR